MGRLIIRHVLLGHAPSIDRVMPSDGNIREPIAGGKIRANPAKSLHARSVYWIKSGERRNRGPVCVRVKSALA